MSPLAQHRFSDGLHRHIRKLHIHEVDEPTGDLTVAGCEYLEVNARRARSFKRPRAVGGFDVIARGSVAAANGQLRRQGPDETTS